MLLPCAATKENTLSASRWNRLTKFRIDFHVENFPRSEAVTLIVVTKKYSVGYFEFRLSVLWARIHGDGFA